MAQARWTGLSMGGPTYIDDPRVQEAVALGQLLLRSREAAQAQNDRLFQRKQETAAFDERRRQFNEEQKRLADAQKMQQADAERRAGLAERELQQRVAEFQGRQQGDAEDRLFRRATTEQDFDLRREELGARRSERQADRQEAQTARAEDRAVADERWQQTRSDRKSDQTMDRLERIRQDALRMAAQAGQDEQRIQSEIARMGEKSLDRKQDAAEFDRRMALGEQKRTDAITKVAGTQDEQRERGLSNTLARFEVEVQQAKTAKDEQTRQEELAAAVQRVLFPPPDVDGRNNTDVLDASGRSVPVWRPSASDLEAMKPALLEIMARHFPEVKRAGYPKVIRALDVPLVAPLTQAAARGVYELSGAFGEGVKGAVGDFFEIPRWTDDPGARALEETLKRNEKARKLFERK